MSILSSKDTVDLTPEDIFPIQDAETGNIWKKINYKQLSKRIASIHASYQRTHSFGFQTVGGRKILIAQDDVGSDPLLKGKRIDIVDFSNGVIINSILLDEYLNDTMLSIANPFIFNNSLIFSSNQSTHWSDSINRRYRIWKIDFSIFENKHTYGVPSIIAESHTGKEIYDDNGNLTGYEGFTNIRQLLPFTHNGHTQFFVAFTSGLELLYTNDGATYTKYSEFNAPINTTGVRGLHWDEESNKLYFCSQVGDVGFFELNYDGGDFWNKDNWTKNKLLENVNIEKIQFNTGAVHHIDKIGLENGHPVFLAFNYPTRATLEYKYDGENWNASMMGKIENFGFNVSYDEKTKSSGPVACAFKLDESHIIASSYTTNNIFIVNLETGELTNVLGTPNIAGYQPPTVAVDITY